jgi:hypothetical protein
VAKNKSPWPLTLSAMTLRLYHILPNNLYFVMMITLHSSLQNASILLVVLPNFLQ